MARVVVLGAGYGGASCVAELSKRLGSEHDLIWVDEKEHHLVLHEVHRVIYDPSVESSLLIPLDEVTTDARTVRTRVEGFDFSSDEVSTRDGSLDYDYLVVALGQRTADYGIPGVLDHGLTLRSLEDAYAIRNAAKRIVTRGGGRVVVGGAGLSGVQVAGELVDLFEKRGLSLGDYSVKLVEALEDVMPNQDPDLRAEVERLLRSKGVVTETGNPVREVTEDSVDLDTGGSVPYDLFVWTGGLTSHGFEVRPEHERRKRDAFAVRPTLESVDHDGVFFVGDAGYTEVDGTQVPATAWAAYDEGETAARNIVRSIEDEPLHRFELDDPGTLVSVGREAVGKVGGRVVTGKAAEQLKKGAAVRHITRVAGPRRGAESFFADL